MLPYKPLYLVLLVFINNCICNNGLKINKCDKQDTKCLKDLFQSIIARVIEGVPDLGTTPLDPIFIPHMSASTSYLHLEFKNSTITGLSSCNTNKIKYNADKSNVHLKLMCDAAMEGQYDMKGQLLIVPLEGDGKLSIKLRKAVIGIDADLPIVNHTDGRRYFNVAQWSYNYNLTDKSDIRFDNLFKGNKDLAQSVEELIADNGNEIIQATGDPIVKVIASKVLDEFKVILKTLSVDDLFKN